MAHKPSLNQVWKAADVYLRHAYVGSPPSAVRARLETLHSLGESDYQLNPIFEPNAHQPPTRLALRLGNRAYPHMKMVIERAPDGRTYLFRADTHDAHACPAPTAREFKAFKDLMAANLEISRAIEAAWADEGLPTFKTYLRDDLARRQAQQGGGGAAAPDGA